MATIEEECLKAKEVVEQRERTIKQLTMAHEKYKSKTEALVDELDMYWRIARKSEKKLDMARSRDKTNMVFLMENL